MDDETLINVIRDHIKTYDEGGLTPSECLESVRTAMEEADEPLPIVPDGKKLIDKGED